MTRFTIIWQQVHQYLHNLWPLIFFYFDHNYWSLSKRKRRQNLKWNLICRKHRQNSICTIKMHSFYLRLWHFKCYPQKNWWFKFTLRHVWHIYYVMSFNWETYFSLNYICTCTFETYFSLNYMYIFYLVQKISSLNKKNMG